MKYKVTRAAALLAAFACASVPTEARAAATVTIHNMFGIALSGLHNFSPEQRAQIGFTTSLIEWTRSETIQGTGGLEVYYGYGETDSFGTWPGGAYIQATAHAEPDGRAQGAYVLNVAIDVTNGTGIDLPELILTTWFSAYAPFLSSPASVDFPPLEYARFASSQGGAGIGDAHACDTRTIGSGYFYDSTPPSLACGVSSPDHSLSQLYFANVKAGEQVRLIYTLRLEVEAFSVPEPATLSLLATPALAVLALHRRRPRRRSR